MQITYLGHAGFYVETASTIIIMDPWLSTKGAFDAAWFQYPKNHHMADSVQNLLASSTKDKYIYVSHEHKDHFDLEFLKSLKDRDFTLLLADFVTPHIKRILSTNNYLCKKIIALKDDEVFHFKDGFLTLFILDMEVDCDSAILVKTKSGTFLNLNDCKIHERLNTIVDTYGPIDVFTAQFSGAVWHPTCYKMDKKKYQTISKNKNLRKFELIAKAIEIIKPAIYLPSAGPPCFLDPLLLSINFQEVNTYPRAPRLIEFLNNRFLGKKIDTQWPEIMPGDRLDVSQLKFTHWVANRIKDSDFKNYVEAYAKEYEDFFKKRALSNAKVDPKQVFIDLEAELVNKLRHMKLIHKNLPIPLYFSIAEYKKEFYCIDFQKNSIKKTSKIEKTDHFVLISSPAWQVNKVLKEEITWADFALTFRVSLEREADIYNTIMHGFLTLDASSLDRFCELFFEIFSKKERISVEYKGKIYSVLRYCPHQGGDLMNGWVEDCFLVCPRHQWKFDLENQGICRYNNASINAICLGDKKDNEEPLLS